MKLAVRSFAVAILLAGIVATSQSQQHLTARGGQQYVSHQVVSSLMPAPACPPDDPDACGIPGGDKPKGK